jgi:hypothetical protein
MNMIRFAQVLAGADRPGVAVRLLSLGEAMHDESGWAYPEWFAAIRDDATSTARAALTETEFAEAWDEGRKLTADEAVALALADES